MAGFLPVSWFARGRLLRRSREITAILTRHGLGWLVGQAGLGDLIPFERGWFGHPARETPYAQAEHLRLALGELGATFIKLGQALSTRPDLVPPAYVAQLAKLQDAAPPVPFEQIRQIVCDELGQSPETIFAEFDPQPLASASIGQAHAGKLKYLPGLIGALGRHLVILMQPWAQMGRAAALDSTPLRANGGVWYKKHREQGIVPHSNMIPKSIGPNQAITAGGMVGSCTLPVLSPVSGCR